MEKWTTFCLVVVGLINIIPVMAGVSMIGFAILVLGTGGYNDAIAKVLYVDILGIVFLLAAAVLKYGVKAS